MKLSDYVIEFLKAEQIKHVFVFAGGSMAHLLDSLYKNKNISPIVVHHEQAGAFAAEAYARINGNLGVTMATSGPGATNLITGIGSAFFDSIPCLYITGQVNTYEYKFDIPVRQIGFQETDIVSIVKSITKYAYMVTKPEEIKYVLQKAIHIAKSGRPGPVLIDIPMDIQRAEIDIDSLKCYTKELEHQIDQKLNAEKYINLVVEKINKSKRPVILAGGGIRSAKAVQELLTLVNKTGIPVVATLMGLDALPHNHPNFCGMVGAYGNRFANFTVANSDLLLVIGSRLTSRQTSTRIQTFARGAEIIHVDIDPAELGRMTNEINLSINCDAKMFLSLLNDKLNGYKKENIREWIAVTGKYKEKYPDFPQSNQGGFVHPNGFMNSLSNFLKPGDIICLDVGQNQIWAAQSLRLKEKQRMLISGGMGAMGFALPAAIGAYMASPVNRIIAVAGDGGFQINIQELQTVVRNKIPVKIILMNNKSLGMVRHFQEIYFEGKYSATVDGYDAPDFKAIAKAYKIDYFNIKKSVKVNDVLRQALKSQTAAIIEVDLPLYTYVVPKLEMNRPIEDQSPLLSRDELRENMLVEPLKEL